MKYLICLLLIVMPQARSGREVIGRVITESGEALPGVQVWYGNVLFGAYETDSEGRFRVGDVLPSLDTMRFTHDGFRPATHIVPPEDIGEWVVTLERDQDGPWDPPACDAQSMDFHWGALGFSLPDEVLVEPAGSVDSTHALVRMGDDVLSFNEGVSWTSGYWTAAVFIERKADVEERAIRSFSSDYPFAEYRGTNPDGTRFRWIGAFGMTLEYDNVSQEASTYFDGILNTLCWDTSLID